jgi:hypothetical protein
VRQEKEITITFDDDEANSVTIEASGFEGKGCTTAIAPYKEAVLGRDAEVTVTEKSEMQLRGPSVKGGRVQAR